MNNYRCFIAIEIPDHVKKMLAGVQKSLRTWPVRVKWVEEQNFHLTLKFLGDVPVEKIQTITSVLFDVCSRYKEWQINLKGIGAFPDFSNPRVIWAGIQDLEKGLLKIWSDLEKALESVGFSREKRNFSPHLTLGRVKEGPARGLADEIKRIQPLDVTIPVNEIKLMKSKLSPKGPEYFCINSFYLQEH